MVLKKEENNEMRILIKGAGDLATGIAYELWEAGHEVVMTEIPIPLAVRRMVSFSRAVYEGEAQVEKAKAVLVSNLEEIDLEVENGNIPVLVDKKAKIIGEYLPDVLVDAIMAKRNLGTSIQDAPLVIGIGPGFHAGKDCHYVIETLRGDELGRIITEGTAAPNTGIPGEVGGYTRERLVSASADGIMEPLVQIGDLVQKGQIVAKTGGISVTAKMSGIVRGMLQKGVEVKKGLKIGDIDARPDRRNCFLISDKARIIGKSVCSIVETKKIKEPKK